MTIISHTKPRKWLPRAEALARKNQQLFPDKGVIVEYKPHTLSGVAAGIRQLWGRRAESGTLLLITYRQVDGDPSRYDVQVAHPHDLREAFTKGASALTRWYRLPQASAPWALNTIQVHQCHTTLGAGLERELRKSFVLWMRDTQGHTSFSRPDKSAYKRGPDEKFEMAAFLRELAHELETGYP